MTTGKVSTLYMACSCVHGQLAESYVFVQVQSLPLSMLCSREDCNGCSKRMLECVS